MYSKKISCLSKLQESCYSPSKKSAIITLSFSFFIALVLLEIILRFFYQLPLTSGYYDNKNDGRAFGLIPNYTGWQVTRQSSIKIKTNDFGIRDDRNIYNIVNSKDKKILCMGDSFTFGLGVEYEEMYSAQLEKALKNNGFDYMVLSSGYDNGWGPVQYEYYLKKYYDLFKPDIVIIGFFPYNDLYDSIILNIFKDKNGEVVKQELKGFKVISGEIVESNANSNANYSFLGKIHVWLELHSIVYYKLNLASKVIKIFNKEMLKNIKNKKVTVDIEKSAMPYYFINAGPKEDDKLYKECLQSIINIKEFLENKNKKLIVFFIPSSFQISNYYQHGMAVNYRFNIEQMDKAYQMKQPNVYIEEFFDKNRILYIDPMDYFRKIDNDNYRLYYYYDCHLNKNGHYEAAEFIFNYLKEGKLI